MVGGRDEGGPSPGRRMPWGFLGMLAAVLAIEATIAGHDLDFTTPMHWDWRTLGKSASRPGRLKGREVLCFGDSLVKFSLMPRVIEQGSGKKAYNFALHTGQASTSYFMLRRTLRAGAKPSAIVIDLTPHMLMQSPEANKPLWAELLSSEECLDLSWAMRDADFFAWAMLARALSTYKERHEIRASILGALQGKSVSRRWQIPMYRRNWEVNQGAQLMGDNPLPVFNADEWANSLYGRWNPHPVNVAYFDRLLSLAASRQIPVYWLLPPIHPDVQARTDWSGFDTAYSSFVREYSGRYPGTVVVDARHSGFTARLFSDGVHLNRRGALTLSAALAQVLREPPGAYSARHYVALDLNRAEEFDLPMEDVYESALVLRDRRPTSRR